jgi:hypothetical protein
MMGLIIGPADDIGRRPWESLPLYLEDRGYDELLQAPLCSLEQEALDPSYGKGRRRGRVIAPAGPTWGIGLWNRG